jgi:Ca2+-transporting ATPase
MEENQHTSIHTLTVEETIHKLSSDDQGLSTEEIKKRMQKHGLNKLKEQKQKSIWEILWSQINNPVVYLLVAATVLAFAFDDTPEGIAIIVVIILNTVIGFWMEYQAQQSMQALKKMDKIMARVIRGGERQDIDAEEIVPGDILLLDAGNLIPADGRILDASDFQVDESPLTGESVPVEKSPQKVEEDTPVADRTDMVFKGTSVSSGSAKVIVTSTGMETEIGGISEMIGTTSEENIPLNVKLRGLSKSLIWIILGLALLFFVFGWIAGKEIYALIQTAIAWTIAAIPEGLPIVASIALAKGMLRLGKRDVLVKKLAAVETLGETTMIFTDKTGTLTENKLSVNRIKSTDNEYAVDWKDNRVEMSPHDEQKETNELDLFFNISVFCNDARLAESNENLENDEGDPLEISLLQYVLSTDKEKYQRLLEYERVAEDPFDSEDKMMGTIHQDEGGFFVSAKGAANSILERSAKIHQNGKVQDITQEQKDTWLKSNDDLSEQGLRVLAYAYKNMDEEPDPDLDVNEKYMNNLIFIGLIGFLDPPKENVTQAIDKCHKAGIQVVMVTGDHPGTSRNIANQVHVVDDDAANVIHGTELSDEEKHDEIVKTRIFSRVDPEQKLNIIDHFQDQGEIVGMTGDGVNDAPALKKADIGIAMGKRGTQVAKEVADMVLKNDEFPSIVHAIEEGRIIFNNIRKFIMYQLSYHLAEIIIIAGVSFSVFYLPLLPLQLLFLNLLSDVFPALALGVGKGNPGVMELPPKNPEEPIITRNNWQMIGGFGLVIAIVIVGAYFYGLFAWDLPKEKCNNIAFFSLAFAQLLHVFNMRESDEHMFINQVTRNKYIWWAVVLCIAALMVAYFVPTLHNVLSFEYLNMREWMLIGITSLLPLIIIQTYKEIRRKTKKSK